MANDYDPASPTPEIDGNACKEILHDKENFMKPEKVKSRWRRNSEMETQDSNPIGPANDNSTCILDDKDMTLKSKIFQTFQNLEENLYLFERKKTKRRKEVRRMLCECTLSDTDVGCGDECLNRTLLIECGSRCPTGDACSNRRFQKREYVKTEPFAAEKKGYGLKVLEDVPRGTFVIEYVGEVLNSSLFKKRVKEYSREKESHYYFMALSSDAIIDARVKGNLSRFINHSCDPNCETQKWTVNGDLRVGFFAKRDIKANEELTFDYQLQRYGRQAQKCHCQSENCKGYIGVSGDEITLDIDTSKKEREKNKKKRLDKEEKEKEVLEEVMGKEEIEKLLNGLRSKEHTLILARLMVRAEDVVSREKLLDIILSTTEVACLRLFLDYHGLAILMCWMADVSNDSLKSKILEVLSILPVPNKNMLIDSKIFSFVQKWAYPKKERDKINNLEDSFCENASDKDNFLSKKVKSCDTSDSETDGTTILDGSKSDSLSDCDLMSKNVSINSNPAIYLSPPDEEHSSDNKTSDNNTHSDEDSPSDDNKTESAEIESIAKNLLSSWKDLKEEFRIPRLIDKKEDSGINEKYGEKIENVKLSTDNTTKSISPTMEKPQEIKVVCPNFSRKYSHSSSRLSKDEKRSLYPVKMHHNRKNLQKNTHYSSHHNDYKSSHSDSYEYQNMCAGRVGEKNLSYPYKSRTLLPTPGTSPICTLPSVPPAAETIPSVYPHNNVLYPVPNPNPNFQMPPPATYLSQPPPAVTPDHAASSVYAINTQPHLINLGVNSPVVPMQVIPTDPVYSKEPQYTNNEFYDKKPIYISPPQLHAFPVPQQPEQIYSLAQENGEQKSKQIPLKLPPNWKTATDDSGNVYFYHAIKRESRWDPPTPEPADTDNGTPTYDEPKTTERTNKHEKSHSRRSHQKHSKRKTTTAPADTSSSKVPVNNDIAKKIKELFRTKMSSFVVQCLNPYRKEDCRVAKITSNEDFKHLARKLTHFVMAKELKHCKIIEELDANQSVKLKARDFIHKYMARYGPIYRKEKCDSIADD